MMVIAVLMPNATLAQSAPTSEPTPETKPEAKTPPADVRQTDPVVVTATKVETPQSQLGAAVSIVTDDDVRTYHYSGLEEALRHVPGVEIQRSGSLGKTTSIKIRGAGAQQGVVLVDGMRVSSPTLGLTELSDLTLDGIDRVEIVRGPQSTL